MPRFDAVGPVELREEVRHQHDGRRRRPAPSLETVSDTAKPLVTAGSGRRLDVGGEYAYRVRGEAHMWRPTVIADLQHAVRGNLPEKYRLRAAS